jgi:renalase
MKQIAIIGAGLSGLVLARELQEHADVTVIEKSRGAGGRMATRREGDFAFDHGAQFFTARSKSFKAFLRSFTARGTVKPWEPQVLTFEAGKKPYKRDWFETHYVGSPGMSSMCSEMAQDLHIVFGKRAVTLLPAGNGWHIVMLDGQVSGVFDWVISTLPAPQMQELMGTHLCGLGQELLESLAAVIFEPCYALMLGFDIPQRFGFGAARIKDPVLEWISINSSKPGRTLQQTMVIHSTAEWAAARMDIDPAQVETDMLSALQRVLPQMLPKPEYISLHRWRFAAAASPLEQASVLDVTSGLGFCGDWCIGNRAEAAYTSAMDMAGQLRAQLNGKS